MSGRDDSYLKAFGENLKRIRLSKGLTQEDLVAKADTVLSQVGRIERGERAPTILTVRRFAEAMDVHPGELLNFND
ncbi:helix-turn-helix transcriptional regulator [Ekhidna sp.]|uniref:helix-turn-helix domain-containing protein n=1 Tax=Ekhidna sp. TaxID=2608089 RepID=UPI0032980094